MSDVPAWLERLIDTVSVKMMAQQPMGSLGYRYLNDEDVWEVIIYPLPVELLGGALDGEVISPGFSLDLEGLRLAFERVDDINWSAQGFGPNDPDGPCISIEGCFEKHEVWLRVLAYAPEDEEPGMKFDTTK